MNWRSPLAFTVLAKYISAFQFNNAFVFLRSTSIMKRYSTTCTKSYYDILGVKHDATDEKIKEAYYDLAKKYHPDLNAGDKNPETKILEINEAFETLGNKLEKKKYDDKVFPKMQMKEFSHYHPWVKPTSQYYQYYTFRDEDDYFGEEEDHLQREVDDYYCEEEEHLQREEEDYTEDQYNKLRKELVKKFQREMQKIVNKSCSSSDEEEDYELKKNLTKIITLEMQKISPKFCNSLDEEEYNYLKKKFEKKIRQKMQKICHKSFISSDKKEYSHLKKQLEKKFQHEMQKRLRKSGISLDADEQYYFQQVLQKKLHRDLHKHFHKSCNPPKNSKKRYKSMGQFKMYNC